MATDKQIRVRYSSDRLFGATDLSAERIDEAASARNYGEYLEAAIRDEYPDADITIEYGINNDHCVGGRYDSDESVDIGEIVNRVWESYAWIEGTDEFDED